MNTLADLVARLDELNDDDAIYASPRWRPSSSAIVAAEPLDEQATLAGRGMTYLVNVDTAKRIVEERAAWWPGRPLSLAEKCEAIVYYAIYDEAQPQPSIFGEPTRAPAA
jgi:broad specificity phosphatase PhoE